MVNIRISNPSGEFLVYGKTQYWPNRELDIEVAPERVASVITSARNAGLTVTLLDTPKTPPTCAACGQALIHHEPQE